MSELRPARGTDAGVERIDIKRKPLSDEGKLRVALEAMAPGADVEAVALQYRVAADDVVRWRTLASDAARFALASDGSAARDVRSQLTSVEMREMQREVRRHRLANAMLSEGLAALKESFRKFTGVDPDDDLAVAELEKARSEAGQAAPQG